MTQLANPVVRTTGDVMREEVYRFLESARQRCEIHGERRRRMRERYHRSWPLRISFDRQISDAEISVALHNASESGIAFLSSEPVMTGETVYVRFFWHDDSALAVPAIVRHVTETNTGYLVGSEFSFGDDLHRHD